MPSMTSQRRLVWGPSALRFAACVALVTAAASTSGPSAAQPRPSRHRIEVADGGRAADEPSGISATGFRARFGVPHAKQLLTMDDPATRIRGVERLGAIRTEESVEALVSAMELGTAPSRDPHARLTAVRELAGHAGAPVVRDLLVRELAELPKARRSGSSGIAELIRGTSALALARSRDETALVALISAIRQGGPPAHAARAALMAYPPRSLDPIFRGPAARRSVSRNKTGRDKAGRSKKKRAKARRVQRALPPPVLTFLGQLGDLRAIPHLRKTLERKDLASQMAAAVALAKLGDETALSHAEAWIKRPDAKLQLVAAEVFTRLGSERAPRALATLLSSEATRYQGVELALMAPTPALGKALAGVVPQLPAEQRSLALLALGRAGGPHAIKALSARLAEPADATTAAFALASMPGEEANRALGRALTQARGKRDRAAAARLLVRASVVRALTQGDGPDELDDALTALLASKDAADREVAIFALVALSERPPSDFLSSQSLTLGELGAAARGALAAGKDALQAFHPVLIDRAADDDPRWRVAASIALIAEPDARGVPNARLSTWAEGGGPEAPLAARALASRDDERLRPLIERLLRGTDPVVRAHAALGLADDPESDAVSVLTRAYRFETHAQVRRGIVRALSARGEPQRTRVLTMARDLDPDADVRALARSALRGHRLDRFGLQGARNWVSWVDLVPNRGEVSVVAHRAARVVRADMLSLPVVAAADGVMLVVGVSPGQGSVSLAPAVGSGDAATR